MHFLFLLSSMLTTAQTAPTVRQTLLIDPTTNCELRYYYFPNIEAFFDTKKSVYMYSKDGNWIIGNEIPSGYRGYSIYNKASVFITDYDGDDPIQFLKLYKKQFPYNLHGKYKDRSVSAND